VTGLVRDQVLRAAVLAGALAITVASVVGLVQLGSAMAGLPAGDATWFAATVLLVLAMPIARPRLDRLADRVAFGPDGDPYAVMNRYVRQLSDTLAVDDVLPHLAHTAATAVRGSRGEAALELPDGTSRRQSWPPGGDDVRHDVDVPLRHAGARVGGIAVEIGAEPASAVDRAMLERLAGPAGLALANVRLTLELRRRLVEEMALTDQVRMSRQRLLDAAREQRIRLAAAVEDRVERRLADADSALQAEHGTGHDLVRARAAVQEGLDTLRDLASGVFPPTLADRGVVAALEAYVDRHRSGAEVTGDAAARHPASVESAAYFCAVALLAEPAGFRTRAVSVAFDDRAVTLEVRAQGHPRSSTVQLVRDRAQAADGDLEVTATQSAWIVSVRLPVPPTGPTEATA
jgi:signal transduction histidine kinase